MRILREWASLGDGVGHTLLAKTGWTLLALLALLAWRLCAGRHSQDERLERVGRGLHLLDHLLDRLQTEEVPLRAVGELLALLLHQVDLCDVSVLIAKISR